MEDPASPNRTSSPRAAARRRNGRTREEWEELGKAAILDLLGDRFAAPWVEVEARIAGHGWKDFEKVQPVQLSGARRSLRDDGRIVEEVSQQVPPVHLIRLPYPPDRKRELERLVGSRRKAYRKYLAWAADQALCGKHAEKAVLDSLLAVASEAGLYVPPQLAGGVSAVKGQRVARGPLDAVAHVLDTESVSEAAALAVEVKNVNTWIYPRSGELWSLLVKAADLAASFPVVPVLACVRYAYPTQTMASDLGFFICATRDQIFSPRIDEEEFNAIKNEFGLLMVQHDGPLEAVTSFDRRLDTRARARLDTGGLDTPSTWTPCPTHSPAKCRTRAGAPKTP